MSKWNGEVIGWRGSDEREWDPPLPVFRIPYDCERTPDGRDSLQANTVGHFAGEVEIGWWSSGHPGNHRGANI